MFSYSWVELDGFSIWVGFQLEIFTFNLVDVSNSVHVHVDNVHIFLLTLYRPKTRTRHTNFTAQ